MDDELFNIQAIEILMKYKLGIEVDEVCVHAYNGNQALQAVRSNVIANEYKECSYNLILIDCNMPFMDGYDATRYIREFLYHHDLEQPIIVAVTGHVDENNENKGLNSGMNDVATKPLNLEVLRDLLYQTYYIKN